MLGWRGSDAAYTGIFDALVGTHALHVFGGAVALLWAGLTTRRSNDETLRLQVTATYWYFVVGVWPVLYGLVYH